MSIASVRWIEGLKRKLGEPPPIQTSPGLGYKIADERGRDGADGVG